MTTVAPAPRPLRLALCTTLPALLATCKAQGAAEPGLPADLLPVKAGKVQVGITAAELVELVNKHGKESKAARRGVYVNALSELGTDTKDVGEFLLAKFEVTNEQYLVFVTKTKHRPPFHWWRYGDEDSYNKSAKNFDPKLEKLAPYEYWRQHWKELSWKIPKGAEKHPVTNVSWRDAMEFAAWIGMRLPTEAEWMLAANGGKKSEYLNSDKEPPKIATKILPVGQGPVGPYGHVDLSGGVWEWVDSEGYYPIAGTANWEKEWDKLKKNKASEEYLANLSANWDGGRRYAKGGWFSSSGSALQLRLDIRSPSVELDNGVEAIGIRLAKSREPGRDMAYARLRVDYDSPNYGPDQKPNTNDIIGIERYELDADGSKVLDFHGVTLIPVTQLAGDKTEKTFTRDQMRARSREKPIPIGVVMTTEALAEPALDAGTYTIFYRAKGMPDELRLAIQEAIKELSRKAEDEKKKEAKGDVDKKDKKADWRTVLAKYGVSADDVEALKALSKEGSSALLPLKEGNYKVPVADDCYLFYRSGTGFVGHMKAPSSADLGSRSGFKDKTGSVAVEKRTRKVEGKDVPCELYKFEFAVPFLTGHAVFPMALLSSTAVTDLKAWRTPAVAKAAVAKDKEKEKEKEKEKDDKAQTPKPDEKSSSGPSQENGK